MPIIFIIKLYPNHNNLLVKHAIHKKAEFLRASQTTLSTTTLCSIQSVLNSMQNSKCSFIITTLLVHNTTSSISTENPFFYFSQFLPPYSTLTCSQNHPYNSQYHSFSLYLSNFSPPYFCVQPYPKMLSLPQPFSHFRLREGTRELRSLLRTDTVLISPFFLKVWTVITGLTTADSQSPRLKELVYCRWQSLMKILAIGIANHPTHLLSYLQTIVITSIPY